MKDDKYSSYLSKQNNVMFISLGGHFFSLAKSHLKQSAWHFEAKIYCLLSRKAEGRFMQCFHVENYIGQVKISSHKTESRLIQRVTKWRERSWKS